MAFDLENAVQQGFNRDPVTNDWQVEARNLDIKLEDHGGVREFRILDDENVGVVVADSDGYLSIAGNAEVHGGHILVRGEGLTNTEFLTLQDHVDEVSVFVVDGDPNGSVSGTTGSIALRYDSGQVWVNTDDATTWNRLAFISEAATTTLQGAYDNDPDGSDATITTNATDGAVVIAGDQEFRVTVTGGINLDSGFDMDATSAFDVLLTGAGFSLDSDTASNVSVAGANLTLETTTSGDVQVNVPDGGGDFIVDDAGGSRYIRAITSNGELQLGDSSTPVFVTVMDDMEILGDLTVQGTTTTINTQELLVEDRLVRLNTGSPSNFSGNVGIEAEVGSDGYVEFHWDDTQGRWEIGIDRSGIPEAQEFRPLPYLAEDAATLDLSSTGSDGWPTDGPNLTAGASVVNTNATNFPYTFGPDMTDNSIQAALEAIDGYFLDLTVAIDNANVTLQEAYKNDEDGGDATITTDATDGSVVIAGTESLWVTATGGINLDSGFDMDATSAFDVNLTGAAFSLDSDTASNVSVAGANLTLETTSSGNVVVSAAGDVDMDGTNVTVDATSGISLDAAAASNFSVAGAALTLETTTSGDVVVSAATNVDVDGTDVLVDATNSISLDAAAASNFTTSAGAITVDGAGGIVLEGNGNDVIPGTSCQDTLGSSSNGWLDLYLCKNGTPVAIQATGSSGTPNTTSGASVVGTNPLNFATFGPDMFDDSVQAALEAIDGYLSDLSLEDLDTTYVKTVGLDINGAVLNGVVKVSTDAGTPALDYQKNQTSRSSWSIPVPTDWDGVSDIQVSAVWSPADATAGDVEWRLEYKSLALTELASSAAATDDYLQAAGGSADAIQSTADNLVIPAAAVALTDEIIVINLVRRGSAGTDTYEESAQVHLVKYSYVAQNIV